MEELKKIMLASFHNSFFVCEREKGNKEYLECLVEEVAKQFQNDTNNYSAIAGLICEYDMRIRNIYLDWNVYYLIALTEHSEFFYTIFYKYIDKFNDMIDIKSISKIQRIPVLDSDFFSCVIIDKVINQFRYFSSSDKEKIIRLFEEKIQKFYPIVDIRRQNKYSVIKLKETTIDNIICQSIIQKYCELTKFVFDYQTIDSISLFRILDREKMYYEIKEQLRLDFNSSTTNDIDDYGIVLSKLIGKSLRYPATKFLDYGLLEHYNDWLNESKKNSLALLNLVFDLTNNQATIQNDMYKFILEIGRCKKEIERLTAEIEKEKIQNLETVERFNIAMHDREIQNSKLKKR